MNYAEQYGEMHKNHKLFAGYSIRPYVGKIAELVRHYRPQRMLDYGCGKGYQYLDARVHDQWGGLLPHCYDPGVQWLSSRPEGLFDGIICTDVLEHIEVADLDGVLSDIRGLANTNRPEGSFAFFMVSCRPSRKLLPDGRGVHVTVRPPEWWDGIFEKYRAPWFSITAMYENDLADRAP